MKDDLAGGTLPSGSFGENAAWWAISALAFNIHTAVKGLVLGESWATKRLKTIRFQLITVPGRVIARGRQLLLRIREGHMLILVRVDPDDDLDPTTPIIVDHCGHLDLLL